MFKIFKTRPKKVKILVVVDNDVHEPIEYCNKVDVNLAAEIRAACNALAIRYDDNLIASIESSLLKHNAYWLADGSFGFTTIEVEV